MVWSWTDTCDDKHGDVIYSILLEVYVSNHNPDLDKPFMTIESMEKVIN